jgi:hypothetical protein
MTAISFSQLLDHVRAAKNAYHRLVIIAGDPRAGKTTALRGVAENLVLPFLNLGLAMSQTLLGQSRRQRSLQAEDVARDVLDTQPDSALCLDNTELLFDSNLRLNPLQLLQDLSRSRLLVATWNGALQNGELNFGYVGHPDYFRSPAKGFPVVTVTHGHFELHLIT